MSPATDIEPSGRGHRGLCVDALGWLGAAVLGWLGAAVLALTATSSDADVRRALRRAQVRSGAVAP